MGEAMGADLRRVRIHTGDQPAQLARSVQAVAFTQGTEIYFGAGAYAPRTPAGQRLLAHELAHTVEQGATSSPGQAPIVGRASDPAEAAADRVADRALQLLRQRAASHHTAPNQPASIGNEFVSRTATPAILRALPPVPLAPMPPSQRQNLQRWQLKLAAYAPESPWGMDAWAARKAAHKAAVPEVNVGVLYENGVKVADRVSAGAEGHTERLLIGARLLEKKWVNDHNVLTTNAGFAAFRTARPAGQRAQIYSERHPCRPCQTLFHVALRDDDTVYYSVPPADPPTMEGNLKALMKKAQLHDVANAEMKMKLQQDVDEEMASEFELTHWADVTVGGLPGAPAPAASK